MDELNAHTLLSYFTIFELVTINCVHSWLWTTVVPGSSG